MDRDNNPSYDRRNRDKNAIDMDDIQLEYNDDSANRQLKSGITQGAVGSGEGKANRISQYKKTNTLFDKTDRTPTAVLRRDDTMEMEDESFGSSPRIRPDGDLKQAVMNMHETQEVQQIVNEFESYFYNAKKKVNDCDLVTLESELAAQALSMQYKIVHGLMFEDNPNFDQEKMDAKIENILVKVKTVNQEYNRFKGEFFAVNEPVINKDMLVFKLDRVQRYFEKQQAILNNLPEQEAGIQENFVNLQAIKQKYEGFERQIFEKKFQETSFVMRDTGVIIQKIELQQVQIDDQISKAKNDLQSLIPQNKDQRVRLQQISSDISSIEKRLKSSLKVVSQGKIEQQQLEIKNRSNAQNLKGQRPQDMLEDISQSRDLEGYVTNHNDWVTLNRKLKQLLDEEIGGMEFDLQKSLQDSRKYIDSITNGRKNEYDDLLKQIQKISKKVNDEINQEDGRLQAFESSVILPNDGKVSVIADPDLLFLKKEVNRNKGALVTSKASNDDILADAQEMNKEKLLANNVELEDLAVSRQMLKALQKIESVDIPRIRRNIDQLEAFTLKNLKNNLNDDNKKSQLQISKMKKNYEDLQRIIDALNMKHVKVASEVGRLKENFSNDDMERINEIFVKCDDKLAECDKNINGDKQSEQDPSKSNTLQARKKVIIGAINKMVNIFNENNKLIKESNKAQKSEKEMADLITKNNEIQADCKKIEDKIESAKEFSAEIDEILDSVLDPSIPEIKQKYTDKNQSIDECDELFDKANAHIDRLGNVLDKQMASIKDIIQKLDTVNPINNPSPSDRVDNGFLATVQRKLDTAHRLEDDLITMKENLSATRDHLIEVVQPLNELDEREVKQPEIDGILNALDQLNEQLMVQERDILPKTMEIAALEKDVMDMLDKDKGNKINDAEDKLGALDDLIMDLIKNKNEAQSKLSMLKAAIQDAKRAARMDLDLQSKIKDMENEALQMEKDLSDIDRKIDDIKRKKGELAKQLDGIKQDPDRVKPQQIEALLLSIDEIIDKAEQHNDQLRNKIIPAEDDMLNQLNYLVDQSEQRQDLLHKTDVLDRDIKENLEKYKDLMSRLPDTVDQMINTYQECLLDSTPDKTADYFEEKDHLRDSLQVTQGVKSNLEKIDRQFQKKKQDVEAALRDVSNEIPDLQRINENLKTNHLELEALLNDAYDQQDEVIRVKKDQKDITIPLNIRHRQNDIEAFSERLDRIYEEFAELKQADKDFEGDDLVEQKIKKQIQGIDRNIQVAEKDRKEQARIYGSLTRYGTKDFQNYSQNHLIIIQIREFRFQIIEQMKNLQEIEQFIADLNSELIRQDMDNATKLLAKKMVKLRQRLSEAKEDLDQIRNCGEEMDGNTTSNEEDEFIDALKDEMPEVFKNIDFNFEQLDEIDELLKEVLLTKDIEKMQQLKKEVDDATNKIEQSEGLVLKLENEIIEWNALRKLCTRDEELHEIDTLLRDFDTELKEEYSTMDRELKKNQAKNEKDGDSKGELEALRNGIISYSTEIEELMQQVMILRQDRSTLYGEFDQDVPSAVKQERVHRLQQQAQQDKRKINIDMNIESDKPSDIYYMITINCRYKMRIHALLKELRAINQRRRELDDKYALLKRDLNTVKAPKIYKPVKGDLIDELFAKHLNKAQLNLPVKRLAIGKYLFGSKQILAKIINGKLVIRVGGGYMSVDEFIEQYGRIEMLKIMKEQGVDSDADFMSMGSRDASNGRQSNVIGMGDMKNVMRDSLMKNVKTYGTLDTQDGHDDHKRQTLGNSLKLDNSGDLGSNKRTIKSPAPARTTKLGGSNSTQTLTYTSTKKITTPMQAKTTNKFYK